MSYWDRRSRNWNPTPPLAPSADDVAWYEKQAHAHFETGGRRPLSMLLLGVTPTLATLRWPPKTTLISVDFSEGMIRRVGPTTMLGKGATAVRADWRELPLATASLDLVLGDGHSAVLSGPADTAKLYAEAHRVLRPQGIFCERYFSRPPRLLSIEELFDRLLRKQITDLDLFRILLTMAMQREGEGVLLREVWEFWHARVSDPIAMQRIFGWTNTALQNFNSWRLHPGRHNYPDQARIGEAFSPWFDLVISETGSYPMADYFPRLLLRPRP